MNIEKNSIWIKGGQKHMLTYVVNISHSSQRLDGHISPKYVTSDGICWRIFSWKSSDFGKDYLCHSLMRVQDDGPSEVFYSLRCNVFIKLEHEEIGVYGKQDELHKSFQVYSNVSFLSCSLSFLKNVVHSHLTSAPVKIILRFILQRQSPDCLPANIYSVTTELPVRSTSFYMKYDLLGQNRKKEFVREETNNPENEENGRNLEENNIYLETYDSASYSRFSIDLVIENLDVLLWGQWHILDVHGQIHAPLEPLVILPVIQDTRNIICQFKEVDFKGKEEILLRDGHITIFNEYAVSDNFYYHVSRVWNYSSVSLGSKRDLRNNLRDFFQNSCKGSNLEIKPANGEVFKVHRGVLCSRSPVFTAMLSNNMIEKQSNTVHIEDMDSVTLEKFLNYIYYGKFEYDMKWEDACDLYIAAHKYFVQSLCLLCSRRLAYCKTIKNYEELSNLSRIYDDQNLQNAFSYAKKLRTWLS